MNKEQLPQSDIYKSSKVALKKAKQEDDHVSEYMTEKECYAYDLGFSTGYIGSIKERDEEMIMFAEWMGDVHSHKYGNLWYDNGDPNTVATTAQLLEKFRSLPTSHSKE